MSDLHTALYAFVLFLDFAGFTTLIGGLVFEYMVIQPVLPSPHQFGGIEQRLRRVEVGSIILLTVASLAELLLRALAEGGWIMSNMGAAFPTMLLETRYGTVWIARMGLIGMLGLSCLWGAQIPWIMKLRLLGAAAIALTRSLSGHAADWGDVTHQVLTDWLHLLAISVWLGGLFVFGFALRAAFPWTVNEGAARHFASIANRFSRMATFCVVGLLLTGLLHPRLRLMSFSTLFRIPYGWVLLLKLLFVLLMLMLAALNRYYLLPQLGGESDHRARRLITIIGRLEWLLAAFVLASSALLTQLTPSRYPPGREHRSPHAIHRQAKALAQASAKNTVTGMSNREHNWWTGICWEAYIEV